MDMVGQLADESILLSKSLWKYLRYRKFDEWEVSDLWWVVLRYYVGAFLWFFSKRLQSQSWSLLNCTAHGKSGF